VLVAPLVYKILLYGLLGVAAACAVLALVLRDRAKRQAAETLPEAAIDRPTRRMVRRVAPVLGMLAALAGAWQVWRHSIDVIVVGKGPSPVRHVYLGARDHYSSQPHDDALTSVWRNPTWVVNESGVPLKLITVAYGEHHGWPPVTLPPGQLAGVKSVNYIGPDDTPPDSIEVTESKEVADLHVTGETHTWLTW
jgi:hypothetical protein